MVLSRGIFVNSTQPKNKRKARPGMGGSIVACFLLLLHNVTPIWADLLVTEIMYHPAQPVEASADERGEFIELFNASEQALDLGGYVFDRGVTFAFPAGSVAPAQAYVLVAKDPATLQQTYSISDALGPFDGTLSNGGETLRLLDPNGQTVFSFRYGTHGDWPAAADGTGHALVFADRDGDLDRARDWAASRAIGGSPGRADPSPRNVDQPITLIEKGSPGRYFKGTREPSNGTTAWAQPQFNPDRNWLSGPSGYGYSSSQAELDPVATVLSDMRGSYLSVYVRIPFQIGQQDLDALESLSLSMSYDDSFVAYLNGVRVAATGVSGNPPAFDQPSNAGMDYAPETVDLSARIDLLRPGQNILAIQGHNVGINSSSDFIIGPVLTAALNPKPNAATLRRQLTVNEVQAGHESGVDYVEFYNPTDQTLDLAGMWLSDDADDLLIHPIAAGTRVAARGFVVVECSTALTGFGLSSRGEAIYLSEADGSHVVTAYAWGQQIPNVGVGRYPDGGPNWYYQAEGTPAKPNGRTRLQDVVINEVMYHDPDDDLAEYIEIRNAGDRETDLSHWEFIGVEFEFPRNTVLGPQELMLVADDLAAFTTRHGVGDNLLGNYRGSLSNRGERISLLNADDIVVDTLAYLDGFPWPVTPDGLGASLERACLSPDFDRPEHFVASPPDSPSPGRQNHVTDCDIKAPAPLVINEFFYHPATRVEDDRNQEFIELYNVGDAAIDLSGWVIAGDVLYVFPPGAEIAAKGFLLVAWNPQRVQQFFSLKNDVYGPYTRGLPNGGGEIQLVSSEGRSVDRVGYDDDFPWPSLADGFAPAGSPGYALERRCPDAPGESPANWQPTPLPSPGRANTNTTCDPPLLVTEVGTVAEIVRAGDAAVIRAALSNCEWAPLVTSVHIEYQVDDLETTSERMTRSQMNDSGVDGDATANDCVWSVILPPQPANTIVRYRVLAHLLGGVEIASPAVDRDAFDSHAYFVDPGLTTNMPEIYHLFITPTNWNNLHTWTGPGRVSGNRPNPNWDREVPATLVAEGIVYDVEVRHQGSRWNRRGGSTIAFPCPSYSGGSAQVRSWRIQFPSYRNHDDIDVLILQKQSGWPQRVSFKMFELAGVPAPRTSWARLRINGCDYNGDAYQIERPGRDLATRWFDSVGDLFKSQGYTGNEGPWSWGDERLISGSLNGFSAQQRYEYTYDRTTRKWAGHPDDGREDWVQPLIEGLHQARARGQAALRDYLAEHFDVDRVLRYMCTINYVGTFDDMFQNHYLYRKAEDGKWCMWPWDMDNSLGGSNGEWNANPFRGASQDRVNANSQLRGRIGNIGNRRDWWNRIKDSFFIAYEQEFLEMFHHLNNSVFAPDALRPHVEAIAAEGGRSQSQVNSLMSHIQRRHDYLNDFIEELLFPRRRSR